MLSQLTMSLSGAERSVAEGAAAGAVAQKPSVRSLPRTSQSLQALRGMAALLVVMFHVSQSYFGQPRYWPVRPFGDTFAFGHAGVEFFFVLSGYIIYLAHKRDIGQQSQLTNFAWKRFRRIYPTYWALLLLVLPLFFVMPGFGTGHEREPAVIFDSVLLLRLYGGGEMVIMVAWSLLHEILFYGVFCVLILDRKVGAAVLVLWFAGSLFAFADGALFQGGLLFLFSPLHLLFGLGMGGAWLIQRYRVPAAGLVGALGLALFLGTGAIEVHGVLPADRCTISYGLGSIMIVLAAIELERCGRLRVPKVMVFLGDASYSIYLVHVFALSVLAKLALTRAGLPHGAIFVGLVLGGVAAGVVYHLLVEVPLLAVVNRPSIVGRPLAAICRALPAMAHFNPLSHRSLRVGVPVSN